MIDQFIYMINSVVFYSLVLVSATKQPRVFRMLGGGASPRRFAPGSFQQIVSLMFVPYNMDCTNCSVVVGWLNATLVLRLGYHLIPTILASEL